MDFDTVFTTEDRFKQAPPDPASMAGWTPKRVGADNEETLKPAAECDPDTHDVELPQPYRDFLIGMGGSGASPYYGLIPLEDCALFTMNRAAPDTDTDTDTGTGTRGFTRARRPTRDGHLFLSVIECGCSDLALVVVTGPLTGRVLIGNTDGFWGPNVSSAPDFLAWYERWLDHMAAGRDNRVLSLTSPRLHAHPQAYRMAPKV
ncbi:SMI1/KNR4 family protein [Streptomyces virginiae]|uniref:SMI1/KNR4 family protein n=1 Tax=Streptomyces virginiae TaxID=1961 RepID=UPI0035D7F2D1